MQNNSNSDLKPVEALPFNIKEAKSSVSLDFELWEILTAFTLAFTLASVLIWFSNLQPKQLQNEFISIEQNKNSIYNLSLQVDNINNNKTSVLNTQKVENACKNKLNLDNNQKKADDEVFGKIDKNFNSIQTSNSQNVSLIEADPSFSTLKQNFQDYFSASKSYKNQKLEIGQKLTNFSTTFNLLCSEKPQYSGNYLASARDLESTIEGYSDEKLVPIKIALKSLNTSLSDKEVIETNLLTDEIISDLIQNSLVVYDLKDISFLEETEIAKTKANLFENIKKLEDWQKVYVAKNPPLREKVIFIFDAKA